MTTTELKKNVKRRFCNPGKESAAKLKFLILKEGLIKLPVDCDNQKRGIFYNHGTL